MKIAKIEAIPLQVPFTHGGQSGGFGGRVWNTFDILVVRLETESGLVGWGEAFCYNCLSASQAAVETMVAPLAIGRDAREITGLMHDLQVDLHLWGRYGITMFALSGLDIALWDLAGRAAGLPLQRLLGGQRDEVPCYASLMKYLDAEVVAERTQSALDAGYRYIKLHERAEREVRAAREVAGDDIPIMLDVNCAWSPEEAPKIVEELVDHDLHWLEEPVWPPENFAALADLRQQFGVPLAAGENACTAWQFEAMLATGAVDYAQPSITKVGGLTEMRKVAALCEVQNVAVAPHSPYFGPGMLATLQFLAAQPGEAPFERFYVDMEASMWGDAVDPLNGKVKVPDGPGIGLEPDPDFLRDYRLKKD